MTSKTSKTSTVQADADEVAETTAPEHVRSADPSDETFEKGSWEAVVQDAAKLFKRSGEAKKRASARLWTGAQDAINEWAEDNGDDAQGEAFASRLLDIMGTARKGDVSKIKTVALAVEGNGLVLSQFPNLSKAYAEARRLTQTLKAEAAEDDAAEKVIESIEAPSSTTTPEGAALILLSKGVDGAVVAILDALNGPSGAHNEAAHRAFMRAVATEVSSRVQAAKPKPEPKAPAAPKDGATKAKGKKSAAKAAKSGASKPKPTSVSKGDPNRRALPAKKTAVKSAKPKPVAVKG